MAPPRRTRLKVAIVEAGYTQRQLANQLGIREVRLSDIVTGAARPRAHEATELSELLRRPRPWLFPADDFDDDDSDLQGTSPERLRSTA